VTIYSSTAVPPVVSPAVVASAPVARKRNSWLPLLTVLFLISYGLMTMLIVEQGSTIEQQRALIKELFRDSTELSAVKGKAVRDKNMAAAQRHAQTPAPSMQAHDPAVQTPSTQTPSTRTPSTTPSTQAQTTQTPSTQVPSTQIPSSQVTPQPRAQSRTGKSAKPKVQIPSRPAADLADERRASLTI
jgi:hypothetical protein